MKKILLLVVICSMVFVAGCGGADVPDETQSNLVQQEEQEPTQGELNEQLKAEAIPAVFVEVNGDEITKDTKLSAKGKITFIDEEGALGTFTLTTTEDNGFGMYSISNYSFVEVAEGDQVQIWGTYNGKNDLGIPSISAIVVEHTNTEKPKDSEQETKTSITWDALKDFDNIVGKSDKDYLTITKNKPTNVRNDTTGKWKKSLIAANINIEEYLLSYKNLYMKDGDVHFIINFNYNTTTRINNSGGLISADILEYKDKEEHDAKMMGSGMLLGGYIIYPDGDIEKTP